MTVRTRFAPSPTGGLHVGNVRTAVLNWLFARRHGGSFILRIEDTDPARNQPGAEAAIAVDLEWLGLDPDEGPDSGGRFGPYRQSERRGHYARAADRLLASGRAFHCFCAPEEPPLSTARTGAPQTRACRCRDLPLSREPAAGAAVRFRSPDGGSVEVEDVVRGTVRFPAEELEDFVLLRSDGTPTYNFAAVVDDAAMRITHVIRGVGHLSNTPRQVLLYRALEHAPPVFVHIPTVLGPDRRKLAKRLGARPLAAYREEGYHPDALVNYLSLLSWSSPTGDEFLSRQRLIEEISLERIRATDAVFDPDKLRWLSGRHIEAMPLTELVGAVRPFLPADGPHIPESALPVALDAIRSHLSTLGDVREHLAAFPMDDADVPWSARLEGLEPHDAGVLRAAARFLRGISSWMPAQIDAAVRDAGAAAAVRGRALFGPLRRALTGAEHGPPLTAVAAVLGRETVLRRLEEAAHRLSAVEKAPDR